MPQACADTRVIKKFLATQPGALKLARRYGTALVCVRYRCDKEGLTRYTTVELLVEEAPMQKRKSVHHLVAVELGKTQTFGMKNRLTENGAEWDPDAYVWRLTRSTAKRLGLLDYVVSK
ncbi:MAG: hypothetical protein H7Y33_20300 [Cytophagales bacterium]|nr:hypothetical protein [Rhizobacter sp.]